MRASRQVVNCSHQSIQRLKLGKSLPVRIGNSSNQADPKLLHFIAGKFVAIFLCIVHRISRRVFGYGRSRFADACGQSATKSSQQQAGDDSSEHDFFPFDWTFCGGWRKYQFTQSSIRIGELARFKKFRQFGLATRQGREVSSCR